MKSIYLDQMQWVSLAKAYAGHPDGRPFIPILDLAIKLVDDGEAVFPLSFGHVRETAGAPRLDQRVQLAQLMTRLSRGVVLKWGRRLIEHDLRNAASAMFRESRLSSPPTVFGRTISEVFPVDVVKFLKISPERVAALRESLDTPEAWIHFLSYEDDAIRKAGVVAWNQHADQVIVKYEEKRQLLGPSADRDLVRRAYAACLTYTFWEQIQQALLEIRRTTKEWSASGTAKLMQFWESIPIMHVELELHTYIHKNTSKRWKRNDDIDIASLSLAIPYCDVVLTERFWTDASRKCKLDRHYNTRIASDLLELPKLVA